MEDERSAYTGEPVGRILAANSAMKRHYNVLVSLALTFGILVLIRTLNAFWGVAESATSRWLTWAIRITFLASVFWAGIVLTWMFIMARRFKGTGYALCHTAFAVFLTPMLGVGVFVFPILIATDMKRLADIEVDM